MDPMAFYKQVCELAKAAYPDRKVGFSAGMRDYEDQWFPAIVQNGAFVIRPPDGRTIPIQAARDWRFRLTGQPFAEVLTFPNWPQCRNFSPEQIVADLVVHVGGVGSVCLV